MKGTNRNPSVEWGHVVRVRYRRCIAWCRGAWASVWMCACTSALAVETRRCDCVVGFGVRNLLWRRRIFCKIVWKRHLIETRGIKTNRGEIRVCMYVCICVVWKLNGEHSIFERRCPFLLQVLVRYIISSQHGSQLRKHGEYISTRLYY